MILAFLSETQKKEKAAEVQPFLNDGRLVVILAVLLTEPDTLLCLVSAL